VSGYEGFYKETGHYSKISKEIENMDDILEIEKK
jgi:hypothetical protein